MRRDDDAFLAPIARVLRREPAVPRAAWRAGLVQALRILYLVARDVSEGSIGLHATSLVYTTLLSFVPLLALSFSVLKGFGIHNQIAPMLLHALAPLGEKAGEVAGRVIGFVDKMEVGTLGAIGLGVLVYTAISAVQKIERAFNEIWQTATPRPLARKFADYLSVLLIGPVLLIAALGLAAAVESSVLYRWLAAVPVAGALLEAGGRLLPVGLLAGLLGFAYAFLPNTRVRPASAMTGALAATLLWLAAAWVFATFIASAQGYTAIYQAFATLIVLLIWLDLGWLIVLIGAAIAFYHQHPGSVRAGLAAGGAAGAAAERCALAVAAAIVRAFCQDRPAPGAATVADAVGLPADVCRETLDVLEAAGVVVRTAAEPPGYLPAAAPEAIPLIRIIRAVRGGSADASMPPPGDRSAPADLEHAIDAGLAAALAGRTLQDLAAEPATAPQRA